MFIYLTNEHYIVLLKNLRSVCEHLDTGFFKQKERTVLDLKTRVVNNKPNVLIDVVDINADVWIWDCETYMVGDVSVPYAVGFKQMGNMMDFDELVEYPEEMEESVYIEEGSDCI